MLINSDFPITVAACFAERCRSKLWRIGRICLPHGEETSTRYFPIVFRLRRRISSLAAHGVVGMTAVWFHLWLVKQKHKNKKPRVYGTWHHCPISAPTDRCQLQFRPVTPTIRFESAGRRQPATTAPTTTATTAHTSTPATTAPTTTATTAPRPDPAAPAEEMWEYEDRLRDQSDTDMWFVGNFEVGDRLGCLGPNFDDEVPSLVLKYMGSAGRSYKRDHSQAAHDMTPLKFPARSLRSPLSSWCNASTVTRCEPARSRSQRDAILAMHHWSMARRRTAAALATSTSARFECRSRSWP